MAGAKIWGESVTAASLADDCGEDDDLDLAMTSAAVSTFFGCGDDGMMLLLLLSPLLPGGKDIIIIDDDDDGRRR